MSNEENKDQLETMLEEFIAKYPDCKIDWEHKSNEDIEFKIKNGIDIDIKLNVPDREDRIISERLDFFCNWALEGVELVEDQIGYFSGEEKEIFTENKKLHFNNALFEELLYQLEKGGKIDWEHKSEKDIEFKIKNGIDIEINICCLPEPVLSKKNDDGQIDFGADPEVTKKLTEYFNNKGKKLRKQKFKVATDDKIFFLK